MSTVVVYCCWIFVQINVLWYLIDYHMIMIQFKVSEAIRFFQPYITSKAIYQTAFGPRSFYNCSQSHNILNRLSPCTKSVLSKATLIIATTITL